MGATMIKDEIEEMAELSGLYLYKTNEELIYCLTYFAKLVAEKEREECAKICDDRVNAYQYATDPWAQEHIKEAKHLAKAIKSRGQE